jgi:hypothetical protein
VLLAALSTGVSGVRDVVAMGRHGVVHAMSRQCRLAVHRQAGVRMHVGTLSRKMLVNVVRFHVGRQERLDGIPGRQARHVRIFHGVLRCEVVVAFRCLEVGEFAIELCEFRQPVGSVQIVLQQ